MPARAVIKYLRIAPRKLRLVLDTVRGQGVKEALSRLRAMNKKGARLAEKAVASAFANAKVLKMDEARLFVSEIKADGGPTYKRFMSRSMGRADRILKRTSHITVVLEEGAKRREPPSEVPQAAAAKKKKLAGVAGA